MQPALNPQSSQKPQTPPPVHPVRGEANSDEKWLITTRKNNRRKKRLPQSLNHEAVLQTEKEKESVTGKV